MNGGVFWATADLHFGHAKIMELGNRPWASAEEMDEALAENWNAVVMRGDTVLLLGDLTLRHLPDAARYFSMLHGNIKVVPGNHDDGWVKRWKREGAVLRSKDGGPVELLPPLVTIRAADHKVVLCHYPLAVWDMSQYGVIHLCGHSHGRLAQAAVRRFDVGVDANRYTPVLVETVRAFLEQFPPLDKALG